MHNKPTSRSSYFQRQPKLPTNFEFNLSSPPGVTDTPLSYSMSDVKHKLIDVRQIPSAQEVYPNTTDFKTD